MARLFFGELGARLFAYVISDLCTIVETQKHISAVAVVLPIGIFAAIYLSEYATKSLAINPLLEVWRTFPAIVYGLFALVFFNILKTEFRDRGFGSELDV